MNSGPKLSAPPPTPSKAPDLDDSIRRRRQRIKARQGRSSLVIGLSIPQKSNSPLGLQIPRGDSA